MSNHTFKDARAASLRLLLGLHVLVIGAVGCSSASSTDGNPGSAGTANPGGGAQNPGTGGSGNPNGGSGNPSGGSSVGGANSAGSNGMAGGSSNPGGGGVSNAGAGGMSQGSAGTGTTPQNGPGPAGFWTSKDWHGCAWTGKGVDGVTTVAPQDFVAKPAADPYCISGTVGLEPMYKSVALLGFNVAESNPASCVYKPVDTSASGPPAVVPTAAGIAVNFVKKGTDTSFTLRVQIQGPNGAKEGAAGAADRWCATLTEVQGKIFVPWSKFTPSCWLAGSMQGTPYAMQPISAVVFAVPGKLTDTPYNFCVNGLAAGSSAADAPDGPAVAGDQTGVVGGTGSRDLDFARAKVNVDGHDYIIQNNNWGNPEGTDLILGYKNNSFKITTGSGTGQSAPASFPSIYIGNNGNTANGVYSTTTSDHLPIQISQLQSVTSTFRYSGSTNVYNATYDIWFAKSKPTTRYDDGIDGFVMVWLRDPGGKQPIGSKMGSAMVAGQNWDVWVGPRGPGPNGSQSSATVVSFVNPSENDDSRAQSFKNVDLKAFMTAASGYGISSSLYLTDVFAGFEIWDGGSGGNLAVDEFSCVVK